MSGSHSRMSSGSSPLARGLRRPPRRRPPLRGIIPARAGFTVCQYSMPSHGEDHPRSRGVYADAVIGGPCGGGSSPLARGLLRVDSCLFLLVGIIPARAGFTGRGGRWRRRGWDHPRSRGVYGVVDGVLPGGEGSSPLARGLPHDYWAVRRRGGIIPARAGFTLADPWNPNEPVLYQTPAAFTADPGSAPPSCGSAVVVPRWTTTPSGA